MSELDWLSKNLKEVREQYKGNWIAIKDEKVVASAPDVKTLLNEISEEVDRPLVTFISEEEPVWRGIYAYGDCRIENKDIKFVNHITKTITRR